jgi:hypothetical protein
MRLAALKGISEGALDYYCNAAIPGSGSATRAHLADKMEDAC